MKKYLDEGGLVYLWTKIKNLVNNHYAFGHISVGNTLIDATSAQDTFSLIAGTNVTLTPNSSNRSIEISASHPTYSTFTGKPTANQTPGWGDTFIIQQIKQNTSGQVSATDRTVKIPNAVASDSANGLMSSGDYSKLLGIATGAEVNQNAFSNIKIGESTIAADSKTDTLEFVAGTNITIAADTTNDKITINGPTLPVAGTDYMEPSSVNVIRYGTCTTAAATVQKTVTLTDSTGFSLVTGASVRVKFTNSNTASNPTLKVGSTTAKSICRAGTTKAISGEWQAGEVVDFVYDGTNWVIEDGGIGGSSSYGVVKLSDSIDSSTSDSTSGVAATPKAVYNAIASATEAADNIFWVTYQSTSTSDIIGAINANKTLLCKYTANPSTVLVLPLALADFLSELNAGEFVFSAVIGDTTTYNVTLTDDGSSLVWGVTQKVLQDSADRKNSISGTESNNSSHYPTCYAVKTYVNSVLTNSTTGYIPISQKGAASGVCPLNSNTKIDAEYLPSYVDDVIEAYESVGYLPPYRENWLYTKDDNNNVVLITPEKGKIYVIVGSYDHLNHQSNPIISDESDNMSNQYRWGGSSYIKLNDGGLSSMTTSDMDTATSNWT